MLYQNETLREISFPLGGIGTGSIGLNGIGYLTDWEIENHPNKGERNGHTHFAVKAEYPDGRSVVKVLQGDWTKDLSGYYEQKEYSGFGYGPFRETMAGFPHFREVIFNGEFPIATITFRDADFPAEVELTAFNPFIPLNADDSGIPAAFFEIKFKNGAENIKYTAIFSVRNRNSHSENKAVDCGGYPAIRLGGTNTDETDSGDLTIAIDRTEQVIMQQYWYRGGWCDGISTFWRELSDGTIKDRTYAEKGSFDAASLGCEMELAPQETGTCRYVLSWNFPYYTKYVPPLKDENGKVIPLVNYYAKLFADSTASCQYSMTHWQKLYDKTNLFRTALFSSTVDDVVKDAISSTICVLKTPTVLRLEDGTFYGWEGVHEKEGSCHGTCTHVWSYA